MDEKLFHFWDILVTKICVWENSLKKSLFHSEQQNQCTSSLCKGAEAEPIEKLIEDKKQFQSVYKLIIVYMYMCMSGATEKSPGNPRVKQFCTRK